MQTQLLGVKQANFKQWLAKTPLGAVCIMSFSAFTIYSCMYGFRKPYTVATYTNTYFLGISYKVCLVVAQVLGYKSKNNHIMSSYKCFIIVLY